jgi:hypothetical protein
MPERDFAAQPTSATMAAAARTTPPNDPMTGEDSRYRDGLEALQRQDYGRAHELIRAAAEAGHARAQYQFGIMCANAEGVPLDYVEAANWIRAAAEQGLGQAQSLLAWLHASGFGVAQDDAEAGRWYLRAAAQGLPKAQYTVASMYRWGRYGVQRDPARMVHWYQASASQGFAPAQNALGRLLADGKELERDELTAFQWLSLAIVNGSEPAKKALMELTARMSPEAIALAKVHMLNAAAAPAGDRGG